MGFEEMVVAIIGTVAGVGLLGFVIAKITGLIKSWIERDKSGYEEETFNRLAKAFMEHKKDMERRMKNLEAIVANEDDESVYPELDEHHEEESTTLSNDLKKKQRES